ncbi:pyrroline-5-carboxylate reductase [Pseudoalteromonas ruthenica]|uniref:pyrroline-5-carboxylate reductase n=1 Tax=Pseudoalteromonas ruthenica TaxID=151081 RepID=UPI002420427F|nr:pyrroline-5-carboxylate reductase [Pseudoalteromonas ruthenica]|tara:strand:- start:22051 stop:22872 length:822 start_codon:yes stop_codon:yes gene_type:complete
MSQKTIAFIGTGNMSYAIIGGMVKNGFAKERIIATNRNQEKLAKVAADFGVQTTSDNVEAIKKADVIVLSVKPQMMADLAQSFIDAGVDFSDKVFISVAAGITVARLQEMLGQPVKMVRCMPNTPSLLGRGVSGLYAEGINEQERDFIQSVFECTGIAVWVDEEAQINNIIAITGSSPAYFFLFMEAIEEKAKALGFDEQQARALVQQTALGAAEMALSQDDISISQLRANVTSKGGTTHAAVEHLKDQGLVQTVAGAMDACIARAQEMEKEI